MLSAFPPLGIHRNKECLLNHLEVPFQRAACGSMWLQPLWMAQGLGKAGASSPGRVHPQRLSRMHKPNKDFFQRFIGTITHLCFKTADNRLIVSKKIPFSCRSTDAGSVVNNATCNKSENTSANPKYSLGACWLLNFFDEARWEVQGDVIASSKMHRWKDGCFPATGFCSFQTAREKLKSNSVNFEIIALQFYLLGNLELISLL